MTRLLALTLVLTAAACDPDPVEVAKALRDRWNELAAPPKAQPAERELARKKMQFMCGGPADG